MSDGTPLPFTPRVLPAAATTRGSTAADELIKVDFERIYAVYLDNLQQKASLFKLLISFVIAPYLVSVAFLSAKALTFADISHIDDLPAFLDFVIAVSGAGLLLPLFQYVEYDDNVMRTARSINNFRSLYSDHLTLSLLWKPNLPVDWTYPRERQITASGSVLVLVFMVISVAYVAKGLAGLAGVDPLSPLVIGAGVLAYAGLAFWYLTTGHNWRYETSSRQPVAPSWLVGATAGAAWVQYLRHVLDHGRPLGNEPDPILEAPPIAIIVQSVDDDDTIVQVHGDANVTKLYTRKMFSEEVVEELGTTYGDRLFNYDGHDQIATAINRLKADWWTNKATLTLLDPLELWPERRMPCLTVVDLKIRDSQLTLLAFFRSQNAMNAYGNMYGLRAIQSFCAKQLGVEEGPLTLFVSSPHLHERDVPRARDVVRQC